MVWNVPSACLLGKHVNGAAARKASEKPGFGVGPRTRDNNQPEDAEDHREHMALDFPPKTPPRRRFKKPFWAVCSDPNCSA